jgi:hypothetical protein
MSKAAIDVMQEIIFFSLVDTISAMQSASKGVPNILMREVNAINANATFSDLSKEAQTAITNSARQAFNRLRKEGYEVALREAAAPNQSRRSGTPTRSPNRRGA